MINKVNYCTNRVITGSFQNIEEIVNFIKNPPVEHINLVNQARSLNRKSTEYANIKRHKLPAVSMAFNFSKGYIKGKNIDSPTGYLYLDVDGKTELDFEINTTYVCACWRSLSNTGIALVVKVEGLTADNLKPATAEIARLLDIPYDPRAVSIDRLTVLPYDPNALFNSNAIAINLDQLLPSENIKTETSKIFRDSVYKENTTIGIQYDGKIPLRNSSLKEIIQNMDFEYNENGVYDFGPNKVNYLYTYLPKRVKSGSRERVLSLYSKNMMHLNPSLTKSDLLKLVSSANTLKLDNPLSYKEFKSIVDTTYTNRSEYHPPNNKTKRFLFKDNTLTPAQKSRLCLNVIHAERRQETQEKKDTLSEIFCNWNCHTDGKISPKRIMEMTGFKKTFVYDYFKANPEEVPNCNI